MVDRDRLLGEGEESPQDPVGLVGLERDRTLLGDPDEDHSLPDREARPIVGREVVLPLAPLEVDDGRVVLGSKDLHRMDKPVVHGTKQGRRRDRVSQVVPQEVAEPTRGLELGEVAIQVDAVDTVDRERDVVPQYAGHVRRVHWDLPQGLFWQAQWYAREQNASAGLFGRRSLYTPALSFASRDRPTSVQRHQRDSLVGLRRSFARGRPEDPELGSVWPTSKIGRAHV